MAESLIKDVQYGLRKLLKTRGFLAVAVLTLALGIGANTAIFSVMEAVIFRPLPYPNPKTLVVPVFLNIERNIEDSPVSYPDYLSWKNEQDLFQQVAVYQRQNLELSGDIEPERVMSAGVSDGFFDTIQSAPLLGRSFLLEDHQPNAPRVTILTEELWRGRFGANNEIIGKTIKLNSIDRIVVGVMPSSARWPIDTQLWVPFRFGSVPPQEIMRWDDFEWQALARLKPGVTLPQAQAHVRNLAQNVEQEMPKIRAGWTATLIPLDDFLVGSASRKTFWLLLGSVFFVLLIASANVSNLLLTRAIGRQKEMALRLALGATRGRLIRMLLAEGMVLAMMGGVIGLLLAYLGTRSLIAVGPKTIPRIEEISLDARVLGFTLGISVACGLLFAFVPVLQASDTNLQETLKEGGQSFAAGPRHNRFRNILVILEVTLSVVLLIGAGLMIKSFGRLLAVDPGLRVDDVLTFQLSLPARRYPDPVRIADFYQQTHDRIQNVSGVVSIGAVSFLPLNGGGFSIGRTVILEGQAEPPASQEYSVIWNVATPGYFNTLRIPLVRGRYFNDQDTESSPPVIIISENLAQTLFRNEDPIGKRIVSWRDEKKAREIVGVVQNVRYLGLDDELRSIVYVPHRQTPFSNMVVVVRTSSNPANYLNGVRGEIWSMDKDLAIARAATMRDVLGESVASRRFNTLLITVFAGTALILAAIGMYGVIAYSVSQRTHEIGIRMALGAAPRDVFKLVIRQAMLLTGIGLAIGLVGSFVLTRMLSSLLFNVSPTDPMTFVVVTAVLSATALLACYVPARRATAVNPLVALRFE